MVLGEPSGRTDDAGRVVGVALALIERDGRWLVTRRSPGRVFAGLWEFVGGRIVPGEAPEAAAVREAREEVAADVEVTGRLPAVVTSHGGAEVTLHLVRCRWAAGEPRINDPAICDVRWVSAGELASLPMPPANAEIIRRLRRAVGAT